MTATTASSREPGSRASSAAMSSESVVACSGCGIVGDLFAQRVGVGQVAVVAERDQAVAAVAGDRLRVLPLVRPGRRVAHVSDGRMSRQAAQRRLVEHRADQSEIPLDHDVPVVGDRDAGALLAPVLERVEREEGQPGNVPAGGDDPDDPALVMG